MYRVHAYIDGYNLYHALKDLGWKKYYWLNIPSLIMEFVESESVLESVHYFTAWSPNEDSCKRQRLYIRALETEACRQRIPFRIKYGKFKKGDVRCPICNKEGLCHNCEEPLLLHHEKETDVNISVQMISDAYDDRFDIAYLVTADSDQVGTIKSILNLCPDKKVYIIFPPDRNTNELTQATKKQALRINEKKLKKHQLSDEIIVGENTILKRPKEWC